MGTTCLWAGRENRYRSGFCLECGHYYRASDWYAGAIPRGPSGATLVLGWQSRHPWVVPKLLLAVGCPSGDWLLEGSSGRREATDAGCQWTRFPSLLICESEVGVEGSEALVVPVNHVYVRETQKCKKL